MSAFEAWIQSPNLPWVIVGVVIAAVVIWMVWRRLSVQHTHDPLGNEFPFVTAQANYPNPNPVQGLQDRINQLEDILRQVYKKLNDRHRELEQTVTSMEAALASLEKPFKAVAERCAYGSRLLNSQNNQQQQHTSSPPPPPQGVPAHTGSFTGSAPPVGYDQPPGYSQSSTPQRPQYEPIADHGNRDESYGFRNYPK